MDNISFKDRIIVNRRHRLANVSLKNLELGPVKTHFQVPYLYKSVYIDNNVLEKILNKIQVDLFFEDVEKLKSSVGNLSIHLKNIGTLNIKNDLLIIVRWKLKILMNNILNKNYDDALEILIETKNLLVI